MLEPLKITLRLFLWESAEQLVVISHPEARAWATGYWHGLRRALLLLGDHSVNELTLRVPGGVRDAGYDIPL